MKLAELFVEIRGDARPITQTLGDVRGQLASLASYRISLAPLFGLAAAGAAGLAYGINKVVHSASDLAEAVDYAGIVFGDAFGEINKYADDLAHKFGIVKLDTIEMAAGFAGIGKGLAGLNGSALAQFSKQLSQLALDFSSARNISVKEASSALLVGLSGEQSDLLKREGAILNETTVKAYAAANGIGASNRALTESEKVMARVGLLTQALADKQDNLANTADGAANQERKFQGNIENLSATLGEKLLPVYREALIGLNEFLDRIGSTENIDAFASSVSEIIFLAKNVGAIWKIAQLKITEFFGNAITTFEAFGENASRIFSWVRENLTEFYSDLVLGFEAALSNITTNLIDFGAAVRDWLQGDAFNFKWTGLLEGFKSTVSEFPGLVAPIQVSLADEIAAIQDRLVRDRARDLEARNNASNRPNAPGAAGGAAPAATAGRSRTAEFTSLEEFARKLQVGAFSKDDAAKKTADNTGKLVAQFAGLENALRNQRGGPGFAVP